MTMSNSTFISSHVYHIDKLALARAPASRLGGAELYLPDETLARKHKVHFQVWDPSFHAVLGKTPSLELLIDCPDYAFAWEAPIHIAETDEVFFCSMAGSAKRAKSDIKRNNKIFKITLKDTPAGSRFEEAVTEVQCTDPAVQMTNGGTNYKDKLLFVNQGRGDICGNIVLMDRQPPWKTEVLLNNNFGRRFNAPNDVVVHPRSGAIFFTDPIYAQLQHFCPPAKLPNLVYRFDPKTGNLKVVADEVPMPNGIVFSPDGEVVYITDTMACDARGNFDTLAGAMIYAYDVQDSGDSQSFVNKRAFACVDTGIADGIKVDTEGNVYAACGDGVHAWNKHGTLMGKIFVGETIGNLVFCGQGRLIFHSGERMYLARINAEGPPLAEY